MKTKPITQQEITELRQLLAEGLTHKEVGKRLGRSASNVYKYSTEERYAKSKVHSKKQRDGLTEEQRLARNAYQNAYLKEWNKTEKGKAAVMRYETSDTRKASLSAWRQTTNGKAKQRADGALRRLLETNTPDVVLLDGVWCEVDRKLTYSACKDYLLPVEEREAIKSVYLKAQELTEQTGIEHHVDHIQPLSKGGEHAAFNLQILTREENLLKGNDFRDEDKELLCKRLFN